MVPKKTVVEWSGDGQNEFTRQETRARQRKDMDKTKKGHGRKDKRVRWFEWFARLSADARA